MGGISFCRAGLWVSLHTLRFMEAYCLAAECLPAKEYEAYGES